MAIAVRGKMVKHFAVWGWILLSIAEISMAQTDMSKLAIAKTICYSGDSTFSWSKNNKDGEKLADIVHTKMRNAMAVVALGFHMVQSCESAELIAKFDVGPSTVNLDVSDAESGESVFDETREIHDTTNDIYRLAEHFQNARRLAIATAASKRSAQQTVDEMADEAAAARSSPQEGWGGVQPGTLIHSADDLDLFASLHEARLRGSISGHVRQGETVTLLGVYGPLLKVRTHSGIVGWEYSDYFLR